MDFYSAIPSAPSASVSPFEGVFPIVPLSLSRNVVASSTIPSNSAVQNGLALMNQTLEPVTVTFLGVPYFTADYSQVSVTVPPSTLYFLRLNSLSDGQVPARSTSYYWIGASAPIRMITYSHKAFIDNDNIGVPAENTTPPPVVVLPSYYPSTVTWNWQAGTAAPAAVPISISGSGLPFTSVSSAPWIQTSQSQGTLTLTPNLTGLTPGIYSATVTVTPVLPPAVTGFTIQSSTIHVELTVTAAPLLTAPYCCAFLTANSDAPVSTSSLPIATNGDPVAFTVATSGEPWLSLNLDRGTTPATLVPTADPAGLQSGTYTAEILVHGPNNTLTLTVYLTVISSQPPPVPQIQVSPTSLRFVLEAGSAGPLSSALLIASAAQPVTFTVHILSGGDWLKTQPSGDIALSVNASAVNLAPGDYVAQIVVSATGFAPVTVPVTLTVLPVPAASTLLVSPSAISLTGLAAVEQDAAIAIDSTAGRLLVQPSANGSSGWLHFNVHSDYVAADGKFLTPATLHIYANSDQPGTFRGAITLETTNNSVTVPVTLDATPPATKPPQIAAVVNAASGLADALAPGEIVSIFGLGVGGTVFVNGVPAPLLYTSAGQVNAVVPYEAGASGIATVKVVSGGVSSAEWGIPLAAAAPAIFTLNASGSGPGAVLNQDSSVNSAANPAVRGSVIQIFATGQGITSPPSLTGAISSGAGNPAVLPVTVAFGGIDAIVQYQGAAPGLIAGALQVNALVPLNAAFGDAVPLTVTVGGIASQPGVTVAVR